MERNFAKDSIFQFNITSDAEYAKEARQGWPAALEEIDCLKSRNEHLWQENNRLSYDIGVLKKNNEELLRQNKLMKEKLGDTALF